MSNAHSYTALELAMRMDTVDAVHLVILQQSPELLLPQGASPVDPLHLEAARMVCRWVDLYGYRANYH